MLTTALHLKTQGEFLVKGLTKKTHKSRSIPSLRCMIMKIICMKKQRKPPPLLVGFEAQDPGEVFLP